MSSSLRERIRSAVQALREAERPRPDLLVLSEAGDPGLPDPLEDEVCLAFRDLPGMPASLEDTVLRTGSNGPHSVWCVEGLPSPESGVLETDRAFPVWVAAAAGARDLWLSCGAGSLDPQITPGSLLLVTDHLNLAGRSPLPAPDLEELGPLFPTMDGAYNGGWIDRAEAVCAGHGTPTARGVIVSSRGPSLDTPAERRFYRSTGASAVVQSMIPLVIAGVHAGMRILAVAVITDMPLPDVPGGSRVEPMIEAAASGRDHLGRLLRVLLREPLDQ